MKSKKHKNVLSKNALYLMVAWGISVALVTPRLPAMQDRDAPGCAGAVLARSGDAYIREHRTATGVCWEVGTTAVEKVIELRDGHLALRRFLDRGTQQEYVKGVSDIIDFTWNGTPVTGQATPWTLDSVRTRTLKQGELLLQLALHTQGIGIVKSYLLYPKESIIQEWLAIVNRSAGSATLVDPASLSLRFWPGDISAVDFSYMIGAALDSTRYHPHTLALARVKHVFTGGGNDGYSPIQVYQDRRTQAALFIGWDYIGPWQSTVVQDTADQAHTDFRLANYSRELRPGEGVEMPKTFTGVFRGDWDELGHQLLDWQYRYKWDYTRAPYFAGTEMEPTWAGASWAGRLNPVTLFRQVFHMADLMRTVGTDIYWRDNGWWDNEGDWNGPDWGETGRYLDQYGMRQVIYIPIQDASPQSKVAKEHSDWLSGPNGILDLSKPVVIDWQLAMLESRQRLWGNFQWRKDWGVVSGTSAQNLEQDHGFRRLVSTFLDRNPGMVFHGCHTGAYDLGYELLRYAVSWSMNDGAIDRWRGYYASYLYPPEKMEDLPDAWKPDTYDKAVWRGRLWNRFPTQGETDDPAKRDGIRELFDIYHYALHAGVFGRWGWVYHPTVTGDTADYYLERLSGDHRRGMIIPSHAPKRPVTIYPKGLLPGERYNISYQESGATTDRLGADLMAHGITLPSVPDGELVYLNLPLHPGSAADRIPPGPPTHVTQQLATYMDVTGIGVRWEPARDNNWVSYYEVFRNGVPIDKVAKGTYYFDHALGADLAARYTVVAVDGSGNRSSVVAAAPSGGPSALVLDDTSRALTYTGSGWEHQSGQWVVAYGTQTRTRTARDAVGLTFEGSRVTWYGRYGPSQGAAAVYVDGRLDRVVNLYDQNEMSNIAVYDRAFPTVEKHTIKIVALGGPSAKADTTGRVVIDGLQVDRTPIRVTEHPPLAYTFTGQGITWVGRRCPACGMADVYVDGRLETTVDQYVQPLDSVSTSALQTTPAAEERDVPVFSRRWTTSGRHTIKIAVRTDSNMWAKGHTVYVDAFHVIP